VFSGVVRGLGGETAKASGMAVLRGWAARPEWGDAAVSLAGADRNEVLGMAVFSRVGVGRRRMVVVVGMAVLR